MNNNPLLAPYDTPYGAPVFDIIKEEHYKTAFLKAIETAKEKIEIITTCKEDPGFSNTIEALELADKKLQSIGAIFFNLNEAHTSDTMEQTALELSPVLTDFSNDLIFNDKLFERISRVYSEMDNMALSQEQKRLTEETFRNFSRNGAALKGKDKEEFRTISKELSRLTLQFGQNILAATNDFILHLEDESSLEGLPGYVTDAAKDEATERSLTGWVFTLNMPGYLPFMQYSNKRELREKMWRAYNSRALDGKFSNKDIIKSIVSLRLKKANLLGYNSHASYVLEENMASSPERVNAFLEDLLNKTLPYAKKEIEEISEFAKENGFTAEFMPWDFNYWSEKFKNARYAINDLLLKPYFKLKNVQTALFDLAGKLYDLVFTETNDIPVYHKDVKTYKVTDHNGHFISLLYIDYFPRASKRGGAWMTSFREQAIVNGTEQRPLVSLVLNFTKPTKSQPSLLTFQEVTTLLHEFGHALHGMLAEGSYASLTGTNVVRDFVELPSQIMENWATEKEFLKSFARHYETGEEIPEHLITKIIEARNYLSGYQNVRQIAFGLTDMAWHDIENPEIFLESNQPQTKQVDKEQSEFDVEQYEREATKKAQLFPLPDSSAVSTSFSHIFSGGYSAGYYSYKWAEVLEADAFSLFKEKGIFDRATASSFRKNILAAGNSEKAAILYRKFRGRDPEQEALLEKYGMR